MYGTVALKYFNVINGITAGNITLDATSGNATVTNLAVTGNANLTTAANVALGSNSNVKLTGGSSGQYLQTDGAGNLSWQSISSATAIANGTSNVSIPTANGNVVVSVNGVANIATFTSNAVFRGSYGLTGAISQANTAPASPQNGDQWYNTFNGILFEYLDDGTSSQWVDISSLPLPNIAGSNAAAVLNNVQTTGTYFPAFISSTANGNYALSSNTAFSANLANGALIATTFVGALSGAATSATTAGTVTTAAQPNITSVGTLTSLGVTGNISAGNVSATTFTGALSGAATTAGTVTTAAQPNITSVGTLTSLGVTGNISSGNANLGNAATANFFIGSGNNLSNIQGANVTGAVATATTAATVTTNAQPNITSVGTLSSLTATGNVAGGNLTTGGALSVTGNVKTGPVVGVNTTANAWASANAVQVGSASFWNFSGDINTYLSQNYFFDGTNYKYIQNGAAADYSMQGGTHQWTNAPTGTAGATVTLTTRMALDANGNLTTSGTVAATGNVSGANLTTAGVLNVTGNANVGNIGATNGVFTNVSGNGSSLSSITGANVTGAVAFATTANAVAGANVSGTVSSATTAGTVTTNAQPNITSVGTLTSLSVTGNVTGGNIGTLGNVNAPIIVNGGTGVYMSAGPAGYINFFTTGGDKATITDAGNIAASNLIANSTIFAVTANISGNVNAGNVSGTLLTGTLATAAQPNITSVGTLTSATVTGNVAAGNLTTTGVLSVTGTGVSSIAGNLDMTSNTIINLATPTNSTDAATKQYVDDVAQGLNVHPSCNAATTTTLASISGGTVTYNNGTAGVGATLTTTGSYTTIDGVTLSDGMRILVKNEVTTANNGIYVRTSATVLTRATDFDSAIEIAGGDFTFVTAGTQYNSTGWVQIDEVTTVGTDPIVWEQFSGAGTYQAGTGLTLTGSTFSVNASQTQVTAVGTLTGLNSSGTITAPAFTANTGVFTGNGAGLTNIAGANVTGTVSSATTAGTVTTAAQPNITSTGTLTSLAVTGNASAGNLNTAGAVVASTLTSNIAIGTAPLTVTSTTRVSNLNVAYANVADNINVAAGTGNNFLIFANAATGNVAELTSTGLTANLSNNSITATTFVGALSGAATSATTAGTVTTAAQPNITSVSTSFAGLTFVANAQISMSGAGSQIDGVNLVSANSFSGNGSSLTALNATNISSGTLAQARLANASVTLGSTALTLGSTVTTVAGLSSVTSTTFVGALTGAATTAGTVTTAAQPNITSVGTLTGLTLANASVISVGSNTNVGTFTGNFSLSAGSRLNATYADIAEKYVADATYEPGTVLLFGGEHEVTLSTAFDSTKVAGVVTTNPAYSMNSALEAEYVAEIALQGRVPVKVTGTIAKGDLLVSASNGHAVANNEARAGTIIGKSLENFSGDFGVIEVAVGRF
jgi:hypothetical protein